MAAQRPGGHRGASAQGQLSAGQAFDTATRGEHQHDIGGLPTDLPTHTTAGQRYKHRVGEATVGITHHQHAVAAAATDHEGDLGDIGDDGNAISALQ